MQCEAHAQQKKLIHMSYSASTTRCQTPPRVTYSTISERVLVRFTNLRFVCRAWSSDRYWSIVSPEDSRTLAARLCKRPDMAAHPNYCKVMHFNWDSFLFGILESFWKAQIRFIIGGPFWFKHICGSTP